MYSAGSQGTAKLTDMARNCVWPKLRSKLVVPPAPLAVAAVAALTADAAAATPVAEEAMLAACVYRSEPGTITCGSSKRMHAAWQLAACCHQSGLPLVVH